MLWTRGGSITCFVDRDVLHRACYLGLWAFPIDWRSSSLPRLSGPFMSYPVLASAISTPEAQVQRIAIGILGVLAAGSISGRAQQPTPPTFRAGTTLVDFTVVAVDKRGNPVVDLRKDEVSIVEDESTREVAFFQFEGKPVSGRAAAVSSTPLPPGTFTNRPEHAPNAPRNLIAIVLDLINTSAAGQLQLQTEFMHYLKQLPHDARVGLYVISEHAVAIHDFTQDAESLRARLEKGDIAVTVRGFANTRDTQGMLAAARPEQQSALSAMLEAQQRGDGDLNAQVGKMRRRMTLAALDSVGHHLAGVPGRKSIVWISHGFPLTELVGTYTNEVADTSRRLATQNIAVYPVAAGGLPAVALHGTDLGLSDQSRHSTMGQQSSQNSRTTTMSTLGAAQVRERVHGTGELIAALTGGRVITNNNDPAEGLRAASDDVRGTYSLGFYATSNPDNKWHRLQVKVSRPGVSLRHRQGYLASATQTQDWPEERWNEIAYRPLISTDVRFDVRAAFAGDTLSVALQVASDDLHFRQSSSGPVADMDIAIIEKTVAPTNIRILSASIEVSPAAALPATVSVPRELMLNPQTTSVRIIVRDKSTGRYGSVDLPLAHLPAR